MSDVLGYDVNGNPIRQPRGIYSQAFILCSTCSDAISSMGGPKYGSLCPTCMADEILSQMKTIEHRCSHWLTCADGSYEQALHEKGYYTLQQKLKEIKEAT